MRKDATTPAPSFNQPSFLVRWHLGKKSLKFQRHAIDRRPRIEKPKRNAAARADLQVIRDDNG